MIPVEVDESNIPELRPIKATITARTTSSCILIQSCYRNQWGDQIVNDKFKSIFKANT